MDLNNIKYTQVAQELIENITSSKNRVFINPVFTCSGMTTINNSSLKNLMKNTKKILSNEHSEEIPLKDIRKINLRCK